ncbi:MULTISPECIES: hypothetical protein [Asticcacaulis]|uniref:hypothetical protein n=1 Tax=Asticcacaulis TaxID=76890 RepID=UPI001AE5B577|nr:MULTISPECIES: hypothetical protein [Asticcacaulis]MBP2161782.1 putative membrane protein AbrB (regulator of aidB expression) [Asticcacaulis solisilvae]MDR6802828.1 putative membrane protein AbrB (regulator of aidB expression) [Asticcacaulis sp. BE141]
MKAKELISGAMEILYFIFSWIVLLTISVIISGKFAAKAFPVGFIGDDKIAINIVILKMKATGDEVALGFSIFILCLAASVIFGGGAAYEYFKIHSGIDVGQWNSLCVISSAACLTISIFAYLISKLLVPPRVISGTERQEMIEKLKNDK